MRLNIFMFLLISSTHFVDVESDIIEEMYKSLKNLEESAVSNKNQMEIISQKIDDNINMVEELKNDLVTMGNDNNETETCSKCNSGSAGLSFIAESKKIMFFGEHFNPKNIMDQR